MVAAAPCAEPRGSGYDAAMAVPMRWWRAATACALALLGCVCAVAQARAAVSSQAPTSAIVYRAFTARGGVRPHTRSRSGHCPSGSEATPRRDAWRCFSGNLVLDPCFSSAHDRGVVVCPEAPWLTDGIEIHLTKPLVAADGNHAAPSSSLQPWALELSSGLRCRFAEGATNVVEGRRLDYFCGSAGNQALWGLPDRASTPWTIPIAPSQASTVSERAAIRRAWM